MAVLSDQFRSFSRLKYEEYIASVGGMIGSMSEDEQDVFYELLLAEDLNLETEMRSIEYDREMVDIHTWLDDPYFMGDATKSLYGVWRDDLIELFASKQYSTSIISGSLGSGKSTFAHFAIARMIYEISCLRDPQRTYGLSPGSEIVFVNLAPVKETARKVLFEGVLSKINQSPYFMNEYSPMNKRSKDLYNFKSYDVKFPKCISLVSGSSADSSFIGLNVIGGVIDELNFFHADPKYLALKKKTERWGEFSKAGKLFDAIMRRMKSRFLRRGRLPGILIGTSSKTTEASLTSRLINDAIAKKDSTMFVRDRAIIDVKASSFSEKKFKVLVGNAFYHSRILKENEDLSEIDSPRVLEIPEDLRVDFENDINAALRDLAGIETLAIDLFFANTEKIHLCIDHLRKHPFRCWAMEDNGWWDSKSTYTIDWKTIAKKTDSGDWIPKINPDRPRFVHLDPALTGDAFGLSIVHVAGYQKVERKVPDRDEMYEETLPVFVVDFLLKVAGSKDDEILFKNVRQIIYQFSEHGFQISKVTSDKFQSREMLQQLESQGYTTDIISVDEDVEPYSHFRRVVYDKRISYYSYSSLLDEMTKLESAGGKVDHPKGGAKDLSDALCGALWSLYLDGNYGEVILPQKGISESGEAESFDENFSEIAKRETALGAAFVKPDKAKQAIKPSYKKVKANGAQQDVDGSIFDMDIFLERG